ncbi:methyl-accepting chemotaxis protein, partial [Pseudomonas sp. HMWF031]
MFDWIRDIRVGKKLCLGFGLVLALTSLLVLTGWTAIDSLDERGLKIESIARVAEMTKDLR